jgi:rod shape determining protein RodA
MHVVRNRKIYDYPLLAGIAILLIISIFILNSIAPYLFPGYFLYFALGLIIFFVLLQFDFEVVSVFGNIFYWFSIFLLVLTIVIGQLTRGTVRWIPIGPLTIQSSEAVRPLLLVFFANFLARKELNLKRVLKGLLAVSFPLFLILVQPSLGVTVLTGIGILGCFLASTLSKKTILLVLLGALALIPVAWFLLQPYQKDRVLTFMDPSRDPLGKGYNTTQSMISVGSGQFTGRGLGKGVQTQLAFLPERHTDFVFASISEELGFLGSFFTISVLFFILWRIMVYIPHARGLASRMYLSGFLFMMFAQIVVHVGMNMGLLPITGVPLPLVSWGGSSFIATLVGLAFAMGTKKEFSA